MIFFNNLDNTSIANLSRKYQKKVSIIRKIKNKSKHIINHK